MLDSVVGYNLRRAAAKQRERFRSAFGSYYIRPVQLTTLTVIRHNAPIKQAALGRALDMKRANVVTVLDELQERGLVERIPASDDRRSYELRLTRKGAALTEELLALHERLEADLADSFGRDELRQLIGLLRKFRTLDSEPNLG